MVKYWSKSEKKICKNYQKFETMDKNRDEMWNKSSKVYESKVKIG